MDKNEDDDDDEEEEEDDDQQHGVKEPTARASMKQGGALIF